MNKVELTLEDYDDIYDTINYYMDSINAYDFNNFSEYEQKYNRLKELSDKIWELIK